MSRRLYRPLTLILLLGAFLRIYQLTGIPPGLHYDIASNALLTESIAFGGWRPVFIGAFTGKEVLFFYWAALWFKLVGSSVFTLRLAAALLGVLAIPATFFAVREVFRHDRYSKWLAVGAALFLAFSFMHVVWSRFGLRVIAEPVSQALALGFLFRGLRRGRYEDFALAGLFTGLTAHTYLAARAFPIPLAISLAVFLISNSQFTIRNSQLPISIYQRLALFLLVAFVISAPLVAYFLHNPDAFLVRVSQVAPQAGEGSLLWRGVAGALGMLFISGEPYDRFNIPGKPIFDPLAGALFVIGFGVTLWRMWRPPNPRRPVDWAAEALLLAWTPVFLLPTALAVHEIFPSNVRAFGLIPLVFVFPARGLLFVFRIAYSVIRDNTQYAIRYTLYAFILISFTWTGYDYFVVWANQSTQHSANDGDLAAAAAYLDARVPSAGSGQALSDTQVYMSAIHYRHPTLAYLAEQYERIRWFTGGKALAVPAQGAALYIFPRSAPPPEAWIDGWESALLDAPLDPNGQIDFYAYGFDSGADVPLPDFTPTYANFGYFAELTGYRVVAARAGGELLVDLRLRVLNPPDQDDYRVVADLVDAWDYHWAQGFNDSYLSEQWQVGDTFVVRLPVAVAAGTPPGAYTLAVTLFAANSGRNLPALDEAGQAAAAAPVGPISIARAADFRTTPQPQHALAQQFGSITLAGYDFTSLALRPGEQLPFTLYWQTSSSSAPEYTIVTLLDDTVIERAAPVHDSYPFSAWASGEFVIDRRQARLPRDLAAGTYSLHVAVEGANGLPVGQIALGAVEVEGIDRTFDPPATTNPMAEVFAETLALVGYDLVADEEFTVRLHWQDLVETDINYTVFVHVRDETGQLVAQHDSWPQNGGYPTSLWAAGEFVADEHTFNVAPGEYSIVVGLYRPETGERLKLANGDDESVLGRVAVP